MGAEENVSAAIETIKNARAQAAIQVKEAVKDVIKAVFAADERISEVRWRQYTPYFNDGDACVFSVHEPEVRFGEAEDTYDAWSLNYHKRDESGVIAEAVKAFGSKLNEWEELLETAFGDHAEILVSRDGTITIDEIEHD